ncbi:Cof-type HAD-IIB family hydrolase [Intestinibacter sp.]|uniref:Cof-type HAD-IIB family hydrolase n=1 Tax=Intestinibacter sp. TaxID=1965304 RepID=UPI002A91E6CC|nr:Cof-type HAD-IIB family hydrolase [Intestinibacter sp.]MDY5213289.1 Cof-type HAD-IIB family hydrolase [Intestinibacter sp.]
MEYKLIVSDMDGTLLGDNHKITKENKIALSKALQKGVKIVPASGRIYNSAREHFDFLDINTPLIACNGAIIKETKTNRLIYKNSIPNDICLKIIDVFEKNKIYYQLYSENTMMCKNLSKEDKKKTQERLKNFFNDDINIHFGDDLKEEVGKHQILKIIAIDDHDMDKLKRVKSELNEIEDIETTSSWFNNVEIMHKGVNKGEALKELVKYLGIQREEVIAFGDNYNDLDMLKFAGMGVVMGNADDAVKKQGDYVTSTNIENGVAKAIYKFLEV